MAKQMGTSRSSARPVTSLADIGAAVRDRRHAAGLTQEDAAHLCGVSVPFMNQLERGSRPGLSITRVLQVCAQLGLGLTIAPGDGRQASAIDPAKASADA
jgi:HTH-type transcriptional regulator / antitoxin HipB